MSGTFRLTLDGATTASIPHNALASKVASALAALPNVAEPVEVRKVLLGCLHFFFSPRLEGLKERYKIAEAVSISIRCSVAYMPIWRITSQAVLLRTKVSPHSLSHDRSGHEGRLGSSIGDDYQLDGFFLEGGIRFQHRRSSSHDGAGEMLTPVVVVRLWVREAFGVVFRGWTSFWQCKGVLVDTYTGLLFRITS